MRTSIRCIAGMLLAAAHAAAMAAGTVKIAFIDPLSGPFANVGEMEVRAYQYAIDIVNARGGVAGGAKLELVTFDNKANPQDSLLAFKQATDQGIRYITQGNSSAVALALSDAVAKHNSRDPSRSVVFLNYAAVDPALTNEKCNFWHFRFDADADMKMSALTDTIAARKTIKKIYLLNQDYSFGQAVSRAARAMLSQKRPDIAIVGDDLHPLGKVKDFSPYVAKMRAAGAEAVFTGNWGNDLTLLVKAAREGGLAVEYYTYYAGSPGMLTALGESAVGHIKNVHVYNGNPADERAYKYIAGYREKYKEDYIQPQHATVIEMLAAAMERARSTEPEPVARALEGLSWEGLFGTVQMRADNHQLIQPLFISSVTKVDGKEVRFDSDRTGLGWKAERRVEGKDTMMATTCKMERPSPAQ
jgi:branched-chain amino acid transport system substrate-binding protein